MSFTPEEFKAKLDSLPPDQRQQMTTLLAAISAPPENLISIFDRIGLEWKRSGEDLIINWKDFMAAEKELQKQGPILKRLITSQFGIQVEDRFDVQPGGQVVERQQDSDEDVF